MPNFFQRSTEAGGRCRPALCSTHGRTRCPSAEKGKGLFRTTGCVQCHGTVGRRQSAGPKLAPSPMPYEALAISCGPPSRQMPPYREACSE